jgi:Fe(3+) dicitrate transport protein
VTGLEVLADYRWTDVAGTALTIPLGVSLTWTAEAEFDNSFESGFDPWGDVQSGDEIPYIPEYQGRIYTGLAGNRWEFNVNLTYQDEVRTVAGSGSIPDNEATDDFLTVDLLGRWDATDWVSLVLKVNNLFDEEYIVSRRPAGVRPGIDRQAFLGANFFF